MKPLRSFFGLMALLIGGHFSIFACSCIPEAHAPACQKIGTSDVVFLGTNLGRSQNGTESSGSYRFRVEKVYKGLKSDVTETTVVPGIGSCSTSYDTGIRYLIFGSSVATEGNSLVFSGLCHGSRTASEAEVDFLNNYLAGKTETIVFGRALQWVTSIGYPDYDDSSPVADAEITLSGGSEEFKTRSNSDGSFAFKAIPPGSYVVTGELAPFSPFKTRVPITLGKGGCYLIFPELRAKGRIEGKVLESRGGSPEEQFRVELLRRNSKGEWYYTYKYHTSTKRDGTFVFEDLESGEYLVLHDSDDDSPYPSTYAPGVLVRNDARIVRVRPGETISDLRLSLPPKHRGRKVTIRVVNADGTPVGSNLLQVFTRRGLAKNFGSDTKKLGGAGFQFDAFAEREYEFRARYWVDDLSTDVENKRLLLASPVILKPGERPAEIVLRLSEPVKELDKRFRDY